MKNELIRRSLANQEPHVPRSPRLPAPHDTAQGFVDGLSHDFRTPLTVIGEFASIMREGLGGPVTEKQREYLAIIMARVDDLALTIDDLLDASTLETGLLRLWRRGIHPTEILNRVRISLARRAEARHIILEIDSDESLPAVYCDAEKIVRAIVNLAAVEIKRLPSGGRVRLGAERRHDAHDVVFSIADQGAGPAAREMATICEPNRRCDGESEASGDKFGLGLNVACELVRFNLGTIHVQREAGRPSKLTLTLPAAEPLPVFERYLDFVLARPQGRPPRSTSISLIASEIDADTDAEAKLLSAADGFLQTIVGGNELVYRLGERLWIMAVRRKPGELDRQVRGIQREWAKFGQFQRAAALPELRLRPLGSWRADRQRPELHHAFAAVSKKAGR